MTVSLSGEKKMKTKLALTLGVVMFMLAYSAWPEEKPSDNVANLAASMSIMPCFGPGDAVNIHQCELRETARLFLIAGQREAALRILCETTPAQEVFRPNGALGSGKYEENIAANRRCLEVVGISK
jgi:hypothetical protein